MRLQRKYPFGIFVCLLVFACGCSRKKADELPPLNPQPGSLEFCIGEAIKAIKSNKGVGSLFLLTRTHEMR